MNIVKDQFQLLKDTPNVLNLSAADLKSILVPRGSNQVYALLKLIERRIKHFTKDTIFTIINNVRTREKIHVVVYPEYVLPVSYNKPTRGIVLNLAAFQVDDISRVNSIDIYACLIYGLTFSSLVLSKADASQVSSAVINYLLSVFIRLFGKKYGLLGIYSREINKLKFLISCYVLISFFGTDIKRAYLLSSSSSFFDYKPIESKLDEFDFSNIEDFIRSLSHFKVMPGINKYSFTARFLNIFGINFIPGLEDVSRFIASLITASFKGSNVIPTFISSHYNEDEYSKILRFGYVIFKGS
jgi:hypothetical protein